MSVTATQPIVRVLFETEQGKIEVSRPSEFTSEGKAYFYGDDYEADVDALGHFADWWGTPFIVHWPVPWMRSSQDVILETITPRTIGRTR